MTTDVGVIAVLYSWSHTYPPLKTFSLLMRAIFHYPPAMIHRGPRPHRALREAIPIAKARGVIQVTLSGPERIYDISIVSKIPIVFARVMFAPKILADIPELAEYYKTEIAQLRVIAKDPAITAELWIRSKHGTWRFFLVTPSTLAGIDRDGKRIVSGQTVAYMAGIALGKGGSTPS